MPETITPRKVLVLEDEPVISMLISRILQTAGMDADIAGNGLIAWEKIKTGKGYGLFIFDIRTPVINGIQLYEYMEKTSPELTEKVAFISGDYLNAATCEFLERVKRPFLAKPFTPDQIIDLIKQIPRPELAAA